MPPGGAGGEAQTDGDPEEEKTPHADTAAGDSELAQGTSLVLRAGPRKRAIALPGEVSSRIVYGAREMESKSLTSGIETGERPLAA